MPFWRACAFSGPIFLGEAAHLAGQAFLKYRRQGGSRTAPLPDFYIGAHAQTSGWPLLTRDTKRYRTYFPEVSLIAPQRP